jgi:hypothetical protein
MGPLLLKMSSFCQVPSIENLIVILKCGGMSIFRLVYSQLSYV